MATQYIVKDNDTLQKIAYKFYKDPGKWVDIAEYNKLDYPYITSDINFEREKKAKNTVKFYVDSIKPSDVIIPKDTVIKVPNTEKEYKTLNDTIIYAGSFYTLVEAECIFPGVWGNTAINTITEIVALNIDGLKVTNPNPFINGIIKNVIKTGEVLFIPVDEEDADLIDNGNNQYIKDRDLLLNDAFEVDPYNDLADIYGINELALSLKHRWETEKGELTRHPDYGSNIKDIMRKKSPYMLKLIELELVETALQDDRIESVIINDIKKQGQVLYIDCSIKQTNTDDFESTNIELLF